MRAEWLSGEMSPAEHKELRWVCHNELHSLDWLEGDIPMVKWLQARSSPLDQERPQRLKNQKNQKIGPHGGPQNQMCSGLPVKAGGFEGCRIPPAPLT